MLRVSGLLCLGVATVSGALLFQTSQSVQRAEQSLYEVQNNVGVEKESLRVLTAEWDYLNRPERLEKLTLQNLDMDAPQAEKAGFIREGAGVPEPRIPIIPQVKPKNILQYVSVGQQKGKENVGLETIENSEAQDFGRLLNKAKGK